MVGITSVNGFDFSMEERFYKIKSAGFDSILLWWGDDEAEPRKERILLAEKYNLSIENVHASTEHLNAIWKSGDEGEHTLLKLMQEIRDCSLYGINTMVLHLTNGSCPPPVSEIGSNRIERLIVFAENLNVRLAFENVRLPQHTRYILDKYHTPFVALCYDSGHENCWSPQINWLDLYRHRIAAIHLHDNFRDEDSHLIPFDGTVDWEQKAKAIAASSYLGAVTIEAEYHSSKAYEINGFDFFLKKAYEKSVTISRMISHYKYRKVQPL